MTKRLVVSVGICALIAVVGYWAFNVCLLCDDSTLALRQFDARSRTFLITDFTENPEFVGSKISSIFVSFAVTSRISDKVQVYAWLTQAGMKGDAALSMSSGYLEPELVSNEPHVMQFHLAVSSTILMQSGFKDDPFLMRIEVFSKKAGGSVAFSGNYSAEDNLAELKSTCPPAYLKADPEDAIYNCEVYVHQVFQTRPYTITDFGP